MDQVGRVIEIWHNGRPYAHMGIEDGEGNIIHVHKRKGVITCDPLDRILRGPGGCGTRKVVYIDDPFDTRWNTYRIAKSLIGTKHTYRLFSDNCAEWVRKVRNGEVYARQVDQISNALAISILGIVGLKALLWE